ncbi:receptor-like protein kinase [Pyrus ussuriensis x Pyrus communis]|uniref:Receptor-like protein kinase n=1 Tax=Pyrus ussuriensis x Pyrus communis TaxID=2448454 RepID=A0A5N5HPU2_9ROSA|nr:receptor-like protein kinase [Pyrus ussuriensis x Pyrus communis]
MDTLLLPLFFLLIIVFPMAMIVPSRAADPHDCPVTRCRPDGPVIRFPFRLKHHPPYCGHPEFEVFCTQNMTMIKLSPSSAPFPIQSIDYQKNQFQVYDADGCLPKHLLKFTISIHSLFQPVRNFVFYDSCGFDLEYYPDLLSVTLLNCSTAQSSSTESSRPYFMPIKCLSVPGNHQVLAALQTTTVDKLPVSTCTLLRQLDLPIRNVDGSMQNCEPGKVLFLQWKDSYYLRFTSLSITIPACQNCSTSEGCFINTDTNQMQCSTYDSLEIVPKGVSTGSIIIGVSIACFVLLSLTAAAILYHVKKSKGIEEKENEIEIERFLKDHKSHVPTRYTHGDIKRMTNGFKKKLGEGSFGSVYSGELPNGVPVAIKVLNDSKGRGEDFINEVGTIGRIHHVNVVRLLGFSAGGGKRAVIYELMPNGSLEKFISTTEPNKNPLDWEKIHNIVTVFEIVGAKKQPALTSGNNEVYFPELVYNRLVQGEALDLKLDTDEDAQIAKKLVVVALWCIQWYPVNRPSMKAVVRMLEGGLENLMMPPNPFASTSTQTDQPRTTLSS